MKSTRSRLTGALVLLAVGAALILARYAQLAFTDEARKIQASEVPGERGRITDRNGRVLAMDVPKYDVSLWKPSTDPDSFPGEIGELARLLGIPSSTIQSRYDDRNQNYSYLAKRLSSEAAAPLKEARKAGRFKGVQIEEVSGRLYPEGRLAGQLIGFTGEGNTGREGIEIKYDSHLAPKARNTDDGTGRPADSLARVPRGDTVVLSIDANLQHMIEEILSAAVQKNSAEAAMAVAMDVRTGEILAYVSQPGYDPNDYGSYNTERRRDLLTLYDYEPGSVFKVFTMASILDMGLITPQTVFDCDGAYRRTLPNGEKIVIKDLGVYGKQSLAGVLALSSNAGVGYASDRVSETDFYDRLVSFGFGMRTGVGLSGESPGSLRPAEKWSARSKPTIAIGQEVTVTAMQMITAAAAVANGGELLKPVTVSSIYSADGELVYRHEPQVVRRVISEKTAKEILAAMESAASMEGTGWRAKVSDIRMAVKTGTAQMIDKATRAYSEKDFLASTVGIFPADDPQVALYIAIVKPRGASYLGGQIAAPVLRDATEAVLACLDIERKKTPSITHEGTIRVESDKPAVLTVGQPMPDLAGYSKRSLLPLLERPDIRVVIQGDGYVVSQQPLPGTVLAEGSRVQFTLE